MTKAAHVAWRRPRVAALLMRSDLLMLTLQVGRHGGNGEEEGLTLRGAVVEERLRLAREHVGLVVGRRGPIASRISVLVQVVAIHPILAVIDGHVPAVPTRRHVAPDAGGPRAAVIRNAVAVQVLADVPGAIAGVVQRNRQRVLDQPRLGRKRRVAAVRWVAIENPVVMGVLAG